MPLFWQAPDDDLILGTIFMPCASHAANENPEILVDGGNSPAVSSNAAAQAANNGRNDAHQLSPLAALGVTAVAMGLAFNLLRR